MENSSSNEQQWDDGTYQTGATNHQKHTSTLVTVLLVAVIALGGLASALGIMNIRLLEKLQQQSADQLSFHAATRGAQELDGGLRATNAPLPQMPKEPSLELTVSSAQKEALSPQELLERNANSLVRISCDVHFHAQTRGLGVVISADGYILANASSISHASRIYVTLPDGTVTRAAVVGVDEFTDLALLYVQAKNLQPVEIGEAVGKEEMVYAVSDAVAMGLSAGRVEAFLPDGFLLTTLDSDFGPLFNAYGQMVGFQVGQIAPTEHHRGGLSLGVQQLSRLLPQLAKFGAVPGRPSIGVQVQQVSKIYQHYWGLPNGLQVVKASSDSPLFVGDILVELSGRSMERSQDFIGLLQESQMGQILHAVIFRGGKMLEVDVTVTDLP